MAHREDNPLTQAEVERFARNGSHIRAWQVRSLAQELLKRREWDAPEPVFLVTPAEQRMIEALRAMQQERKDAA